MLKSGSYAASANAANADAVLRLAGVAAGAVVAIDFLGHHLTVDGSEQTSPDITAFFAAYEASPKNVLTVGSITSNGFSVRDLVIDRADASAPPVNHPVGAVSDTDATANLVAENAAAGTVVGVTALATDPDATDTVGYAVSDARFQIDANGVITVASGAIIDAESEQSITLHVTATSSDTTTSTADFVVQVGDVNEFAVGPISDTDAGGDTVATTAANGALVGITAFATDADHTTNAISYTLDGDAGAFAIDATTGQVTVGDASKLTAGTHAITVRATSADASFSTQTFNVEVTSSNTAPTAVTLDPVAGALPENADTHASLKIADIHVTDADGVGSNELSLAGADAALFEIVAGAGGPELHLRAGTVLDFETAPHLDVQVLVDDPTVGTTPDASVDFRLEIGDVNEAPTAVTLAPVVSALAEGTDVTASLKVADILVTDPDDASGNQLSLAGADAALFEIVTGAGGPELHLLAGTVLDFETKAQFDVVVQVDDPTVGGTPDASAGFHLDVTDVNEAPTAVTLAGVVAGIDETPATAAVKVADIVVTDDALGADDVSLSGADAALFEVVTAAGGAKELWLLAGQVLDFETKSSLDVTVTVADATLAGSTPVTTTLALPVNNVAEQYGNIAVDGDLSEWDPSTRLDTPTAGAPGFVIRGTYQADAFVIGIESTTVAIGPGTTIWVNSDLDRGTGFDTASIPRCRFQHQHRRRRPRPTLHRQCRPEPSSRTSTTASAPTVTASRSRCPRASWAAHTSPTSTSTSTTASPSPATSPARRFGSARTSRRP